MTFRDDRDALLAQAHALRVQLAEAQAKLAAVQADDDDTELRAEVERLRVRVETLEQEPPPPPTAPAPAAPPAPRETFGSTIRGPAPDLPPPGNPGMALLALVGILVVAAAFAAIALSGN